jgi:hypothetical protein
LGNDNLERLFLGCWKADNQMNLSELMKERRIDLESVNVSTVSVEALDNLLLNEIVTVESDDSLLHLILKLGSGYRDLLRHIKIEFLSDDGLSFLEEILGIPSDSIWQSVVQQIAHPRFPDSQIISDFPEILAELRKKQISLLWRGSRDGFGASEFHRLCDGHANTLTVILDTKGNIFGGFTPVKWESRLWNAKYGKEHNRRKEDDSLKSFLFTLKNPRNFSSRRFALKDEEKHRAIFCDSEFGPCFGCGYDIYISGNCNTNANSCTSLGGSCINDTGLFQISVFTGSQYFQVKEIEVFEITD